MKTDLKTPCILLNDKRLFPVLEKALLAKGQERYESLLTPQGTRVWVAHEKSDPHFVEVQNSGKPLRSLLQWAEAQLRPQNYIGTGILNPDQILKQDEGMTHFLPSLCLRSAGPVALGQNFVLYEEMVFDDNVQAQLAKVCPPTMGRFGKKILFSSDLPHLPLRDFDWLQEKTQCASYDTLGGNLLKYGQYFTRHIGCLYFAGTTEEATAAFLDYWVGD